MTQWTKTNKMATMV